MKNNKTSKKSTQASNRKLSKTAKLKKDPVHFRMLTGITVDKFDSIYKQLEPKYKEYNQKRLESRSRKRKIGLYEDRIMRKVRAIDRGVLHPFDCRATGAQLAISPDGSLGICHEGVGCNNFFFGKVSRDFVFGDNPVLSNP